MSYKIINGKTERYDITKIADCSLVFEFDLQPANMEARALRALKKCLPRGLWQEVALDYLAARAIEKSEVK